MTRRNGRLRARGQSEVLGFVFVFTLVVTMVALITGVGYVELGEVRTQEQVNNAERGVTLLAENVHALVRQEAPSRQTRLALGGGSLRVGNATTVTVTSTAVNGTESFNRTYQVRPLVYQLGETKLLLVDGAVIRQRDGAVMVKPPSMVLTADHAVIPVVDVTMRPAQVDQASEVVVRTTRVANASQAMRTTQQPQNVTVTVTSPRAGVWERYFAGHDDVTCSRTGQTVSCALTARRTSVVAVEIRASVRE